MLTSRLASFMRPRYGAAYVAPSAAAVSAWCAEYTAVIHSGTLSSRRAFPACAPNIHPPRRPAAGERETREKLGYQVVVAW